MMRRCTLFKTFQSNALFLTTLERTKEKNQIVDYLVSYDLSDAGYTEFEATESVRYTALSWHNPIKVLIVNGSGFSVYENSDKKLIGNWKLKKGGNFA